MKEYNTAVIGAGPGGYVAAIRCAQLGLNTVVIEKNKAGGTCLNVGCIPTKTLIHNAQILHDIKSAKKRGIVVGTPQINMRDTMKMKKRVVSQLVGGVEMLLQKNNVDYISGEAIVESAHSILVGEERIGCENLILATGSSNAIPPIPGLQDDGILTSTELLDIDYIPETLCIIGGGVIGCEMASVFSAFGSKVTIVEMLEHLVPNMDTDASETLRSCFENDGISVKTGCKVQQVSRVDEKYSIIITGKTDETIEAERVLLSVGRHANSEGLSGLDLRMERGYIVTDRQMRTSIPNVYAIGDVTGKIQLAHVATAQGIVAAESIAGRKTEMRYNCVPSCIYCIPEIASVGLTEQAAVSAGYQLAIGNFPMAACGRAKTMGEMVGFTKIIADKKSGRVLGATVVGPCATEIIGELSYIVSNSGTLSDIIHTIHAHPTVNETILEAAHMALGEPINI